MQTEVCALAPLALPGAFFELPASKPQTQKAAVAIFHLSVKTISRSAGPYRAGEKITDHQTGEVFDYRRKAGVESAEVFLPAGAPLWANGREALWNAAEQSETRKNSTVAREFEVALPAELTARERQALAHDFTQALVAKYGFAADCAIHSPHQKENQKKRKDEALENGDSRNHHAHILCSTRKLTAEGFTVKTRALDDRASGAEQVIECRELFAQMTNAALAKAGHSARVDHRSLVAQGIDEREASIHLGPIATAIERRGEVSEKTQHHQARQAEAASKVAAMLAIAQAQAKAAEQAVAVAQAQELAISTQLTALKEIENDRIRDEAFSLIDSNVRAAKTAATAASQYDQRIGRINGFIQSDHASIGKNLGAASGDLGRAVQGAERRVAQRHYGRVVEAARSQFERAGGIVQQVADQVAQQVAARLELVRQQAAAKPVGIDPRSAYHPDNIAKREAREAAAAAAKPRVMMPDRPKIERRPVEQGKPVAPPSPPQLTHQQVMQVIQLSIDTRARWDAALVTERALYLQELTAQAYAKACAHVVEHQAHFDAKPMLFGREKWELQMKRFDNQDEKNRHEWDRLKTGSYPSVAREKEAVQKAVEQRVSDKDPELAQAMPNALAILQMEGKRVAAEKQAQWETERRREQEAREAQETSNGQDKARADKGPSR
jgi:MobA/MobL family